MNAARLSIIVVVLFARYVHAQDTFSIVAADSATREVGSAGASCVDLFSAGIADPSFLGDLLPDTGVINTQAAYLASNQNNARARMRAGDTPAQMIAWLTANDAGGNATTRQYGIVEFAGSHLNAEGYTGVNCMNYKNHITGSINGIYYSIQGNILLGQLVLDSMESRFRNAQGDLACRLMAALQGANMVGADTRCTNNGTSSLFAFVKVAQPTDNYGSPSFIVTVKTQSNAHLEPVDTLQTIFDMQHSCSTAALSETSANITIRVYPNPSGGKIIVEMKTGDKTLRDSEINVYRLTGEKIFNARLVSDKTVIDLSREEKGIYFYELQKDEAILKTGKFFIE